MLIAHLPKYSALLSLTMTTLMSFPAHTQEWVLTEKSLIEEFQKASPDRLRSLANLQSSQADLESLNGDYGFKSLSQARFQDSGEKAIASFIPTFGPTYYLSTGVSKKTRNGAEFDVSVFADQQSTADGFIDKATRTGLVFNLSADLWKNLFGRLDKAKILRAEFKNERQKIENEIRNRELELDLRKVYWSLVANNEKLKAAKLYCKSQKNNYLKALNVKGSSLLTMEKFLNTAHKLSLEKQQSTPMNTKETFFSVASKQLFHKVLLIRLF